MELELGLALPSYQTPIMMEGFDLNYSGSNFNGMEIEKKKVNVHKDHHVEIEGNKTLSLLLWSGQPNEEDDDREKWTKLHVNDENIDEENNDELVGWPPINSSRIELLHRHHGGGWIGNHRPAQAVVRARNSSTYVKVKMEGVAIGRKIDLRLYNSYQALRNSLIEMFAKYNRIDRMEADNRILYQDKEGDWMLVGDAPWGTFVESVQRIEILRSDELDD